MTWKETVIIGGPNSSKGIAPKFNTVSNSPILFQYIVVSQQYTVCEMSIALRTLLYIYIEAYGDLRARFL
jgi:hypothetical protein